MPSFVNRTLCSAVLCVMIHAPAFVTADTEEPIHGRYALPVNPFTEATPYSTPTVYSVVIAEGLSLAAAQELAATNTNLRVKAGSEGYAVCMGAWETEREGRLAAAALGRVSGGVPIVVALDAGEITPPPAPGSFVVSLGSFEAAEEATTVATELAEQGFVLMETISLGGQYHVIIGDRFRTLREARAELAELKELDAPADSSVVLLDGSASSARGVPSPPHRDTPAIAVALR